MHPLPHGYTNRTLGDGRSVRKTYAGPDAALRHRRERDALRRLTGRLPVPPVLDETDGTLTLGFLPGTHGQELIDAGHAAEVLTACGELLRRIHATGMIHGDYGPNNILLDPSDFTVTAVLDWEFAHPLPDPVEDLAWCEWIVRTHHPAHAAALPRFFTAYGPDLVPPWPARQAAMLAKCAWLRGFCERWEPGGAGVRLWEERAAITAEWRA
ncbi:phosphotransferase [Streptomyces sp. A7024]|uniref:Phosphotransferase n=1 Tax=Streptomyces coryli TaxID=1128680 RepID=A0A6G4UAW2_9ACTN|nr:phosphotransferase [Streptomyces coryli]NGN68331.1 phosphotransferase [Streptomyces coryli]